MPDLLDPVTDPPVPFAIGARVRRRDAPARAGVVFHLAFDAAARPHVLVLVRWETPPEHHPMDNAVTDLEAAPAVATP